MKQKLIFLMIGLFLLAMPFVFSTGEIIKNGTNYTYWLNETSGTKVGEQLVRTGLVNGTASSDNWVAGPSGCGNAFDTNNDTDYIWTTTLFNMDLIVQQFSLAFWAKLNDNTAANQVFMSSGGRATAGFDLGGAASEGIVMHWNDGGVTTTYLDTEWIPPNDEWFYYAFIFDMENNFQAIYINGKLNVSSSTEADIGYVTARCYMFGGTSDDCIAFNPAGDFVIDDITIWKGYVLNANNVTYLYNDGTCLPYPFHTIVVPPAEGQVINNTKPNITIDYPTNGTKINNGTTYPIKINGTTVVQNESIQNLTINSTQWHNVGNSTEFNISFNGTYVEGEHWVLNLTVNSSQGNHTSTIVYFTFDSTIPSITTSISNNHTLANPHVNFTFEITIADENQIWSFNVSTPEGFVFNVTGLDTQEYIYNGSVNVTTYGIGVHEISVWGCDAHTDKLIEKYDTEKDIANSKLTYDTRSNNIEIKLIGSTATLNDFDTYKETDKYIFWFNFDEPESKTLYTYTFNVNAPNLKYLPDSSYAAHFISRNNWIDFEFGDDKAIYKVNKISPDSYNIEITTAKTRLFFESIGDLNCFNEIYKYYIYNYTAYYSPNVLETSTTEFKVQLDFKDIVLNGTALLNYDGVEYNSILNSTSTNQWNYTINITVPSVSGNITNVTFLFTFDINRTLYDKFNTSTSWSQIVSRIQLTECGDLTRVSTLNISFFNENAPTQYLEAGLDTLFQVWTNDSTNFLNFTFAFRGDTNYSICMYPNSTMHVNAQMFYNTTSGFRQRWFLRNAALTTNTSFLNLYGFETTTDIDTLRGVLRTSSFAFLPNIYTSLQRFYTSENVWRTVQKDLSDDYGQVNFNIIETIEDYRLLFFSDYTLIDQTDSLKFLCDINDICSVNFIVEETIITLTPNLILSSAYDNNSQIYQLNWTDGTGLTNSVRLWVTQLSGTGSETICDTTVSSSSGTINCDTTGYGGTLRAQIYSAASPLLPSLVEMIYKAVDRLFQTGALDHLETTFWGYGIVITLVIGAAVYSIAFAGLILIFGLIVLYLLGLTKFIGMFFIGTVIIFSVVVAILTRRGR